MVIHSNSGWIAFEELRGPIEATTVITNEPKLGESLRKPTQRSSGSRNSTRSSTSRYSSDASSPSSAGLPPSSSSSFGERSSRLPVTSGYDKNRFQQESSAPRLSRMSEEREQAKQDVIRRRTVRSKSTSTINSSSSRTPATSDNPIGGRGRDRSPLTEPTVPKRGRSRGRSDEYHPTDKFLQNCTRSSSRARSTTSARSSVLVPSKQERGRSSSRSRLPPASLNSRQRARSRSQSLTRVTSPTAVSLGSKSAHAMRGQSGSRPPPCNSLRHGASPSSTNDSNIGRDISFGRSESAVDTSLQSQKSGIMEKLFGDPVTTIHVTDIGIQNRPRTLLAATVYHNTATNLWITTINTNQRGVPKNPALANKFLKAFSFQTEREARESAIANAPPKMVPFGASPFCFVCEGKFAVFRRASHCRNCGVCICSQCSTHWPSKVLPDTYNLKNKTSLKICKNCDILSSKFKEALLAGNYEEAVVVYACGNVNLRTPFPASGRKGEAMYPIHCAIQGGNLDVIRWLVEDRLCPVKLIRSGSGRHLKRGVDSLILTSHGRSVLSIAIERLKVDVMRYLVVDCGVSVHESTDLKASLRALEAALTSLPPSNQHRLVLCHESPLTLWDKANFDEMSGQSSLGSEDYIDNDSIGKTSFQTQTRRSRSESCIICCERKINFVTTPCGHQTCCLDCSSNLFSCPVCSNRGEFIKILRA